MSLLDHLLRVKNLDAYSRPKQKKIIGQLALAYYLRKGAVPGWVVTLQKLAAIAPPDFKFNPYHDELGRFTFGPGSLNDDPIKPVDAIKPVYPIEDALAFLFGGEALSIAKEALGLGEGLGFVGESAEEADTSGLTSHAAERLAERGITDDEVQEAIRTAKESGGVTTQTGKYGTPQNVYKGSNGVTVVVETSGRNAGKVITSYRH